MALLPLLSAWGMQRLRAEDDGAAANTISGWADRVKTFGAKLAQEQIFVHMDNTCYFLGDTIYYKAYVRQSSTGKPSRMSGVLYADLINQDGFLVQREQL